MFIELKKKEFFAVFFVYRRLGHIIELSQNTFRLCIEYACVTSSYLSLIEHNTCKKGNVSQKLSNIKSGFLNSNTFNKLLLKTVPTTGKESQYIF